MGFESGKDKVELPAQKEANNCRSAQNAQNRLNAILSSTRDAIIGFDLEGSVTDWNRGAELLFGFAPEEVVGKQLDYLIPEELRQERLGITARVLSGETVSCLETERLRRDGKRLCVSFTESPIRDQDGKVVGRSMILRDMTEAKKAELELKRGLKLRDEFISIASHELKTPLTSMKLQAQIMRRAIAKGDPDAFAPDKFEKLVSQTERQVDRLNRLVEDMLDISQIASGKLLLQREPTDLGVLVHETLASLSGFIRSTECTIQEEIEPNLVGSWDRYRVEQVLANYLTNACRFSPGKAITVRAFSAGPDAVLEVEDQGPGVATEDQKRIFRRFERASPASHGGFGLGLYIVREIVRLHGGRVGVRSVLGQGATFWARLPKAPPSEA